jgi:hypothetical protein
MWITHYDLLYELRCVATLGRAPGNHNKAMFVCTVSLTTQVMSDNGRKLTTTLTSNPQHIFGLILH